MGGGVYSSASRESSGRTEMFTKAPINETFKETNLNIAMDPKGITIRESRDSEEHPNSVPIIVGLDVTASMSYVPGKLIGEGLPTMMDGIIQAGVPDPQVLFLGIGDHECDRSPLQVGQFESSDELMDKWLTSVYLEGGGGGNLGESYLLAWYFAAHYTSHDAQEKRGKKGYLFTIGDEPPLLDLPAADQERIMGDGQYSTEYGQTLLDRARETYHVYHIHVTETGAGNRFDGNHDWKELMGQYLLRVKSWKDIPKLIASIVAGGEKADSIPQAQESPVIADELVDNKPEDML